MNRRQSLKALAIGSIGAATPLVSFENKIGQENQKNEIAENEIKPKERSAHGLPHSDHIRLHIVAEKNFLDSMPAFLAQQVIKVPLNGLDKEELIQQLAGGDAMVWIGPPGNIPKELSVGGFKISTSKVSISVPGNAPLPLDIDTLNDGVVYSAYLAPPKEMPNHNVDEEVRADFLPVMEAYDRYGNLTGYPGVLMSYYAPSLAGRRFKGSECFFFFFENPLEVSNAKEWSRVIEKIIHRRQSGLQVTAFDTNYASYRSGERVQARTRISNRRSGAVSCLIKYYYKAPGHSQFTPLTETRRVAESRSETEALCDFLPGTTPGLWTVRMEIAQDVEQAEKLSIVGNPEMIDRRDIGFMILQHPLQTPDILEFKGAAIVLGGEEGFWAGTHYYPSTSWWEWAWRDFRPLKAAEDLAAIRRAGYRIVRVWIDPVIDEPVLRAMDAAIQLASENGIVLDICIFTQWVRQIGFERPSGEQVLFEYRHPRDFNVVSFSLRNLDLQREYVKILGARWKNAGNIFYNLANEVYLKDPDDSQVDEEVAAWKNIPRQNGTVRDSLLFRRWASEITAALRSVGGMQAAMPGYMFSTMNGGDVYLGNADAPVVPWHSYLPPEKTALTLQYFDPVSSGRPIILEEFGTLGWNSIDHYDANVHYALAAGAACAMSYEWGVSWLSRESCFWPLPLREASVANPDPRWFAPYLDLGKTWSEKGVGLCPTPSGTGYGSIYHGTPFPAEAATALGRLGIMGRELQRVAQPEKVYVVIPTAQLDAQEAISKTLKALWSEKILFGVWQENDLDNIPSSAKAVICTAPVSQHSIERLNTRGIKIFRTDSEWTSYKDFEKAELTNGEKIDVITRRTSRGTLFLLASAESKTRVSLKYKGSSATIGLNKFGLVHISDKGVILLEGKDQLVIGRAMFCTIDAGRITIASEDGQDLLRSKKLKLMLTKPTRITFSKKIAGVYLSDGFGKERQARGLQVSGASFTIDDQTAKYVIHVKLQ